MRFTWPNTVIDIVAIIAISLVIRGILIHLIDRAIAQAAKRSEERTSSLGKRAVSALAKAGGIDTARQTNRTRTLGSLLRSVVNAVIFLIALLMILQSMNLNIAPILASAGIGGVALGFGAQSLVKDIISGIFLILEDQLGVGDWVTINAVSGRVISIGLRCSQIQDSNGQIWYLRNGEITRLGNQTQGWSSSYLHFPVMASEDPEKILAILSTVCEQFNSDPTWASTLIEDISALGLTSIEHREARYTISAKCVSNQQGDLERALRTAVISSFNKESVTLAEFSPRQEG